MEDKKTEGCCNPLEQMFGNEEQMKYMLQMVEGAKVPAFKMLFASLSDADRKEIMSGYNINGEKA
jgi:hypothetical protein